MSTPDASMSQYPAEAPAKAPSNSQTALVSTASLAWKRLDPRLKDEELLRGIYQAAKLNEGAHSYLNKEQDWLVEGELPTAKSMANHRNACLPHLIVDGYRKMQGLPLHEDAIKLARQPLNTPLTRPVRIDKVRLPAITDKRHEAEPTYRSAIQ